MFKKLTLGHWVVMIPRKPPAVMEGLTMAGKVCSLAWPEFTIELLPCGRGFSGIHFRADENEELAVRIGDRSLWEIGRTYEDQEITALPLWNGNELRECSGCQSFFEVPKNYPPLDGSWKCARCLDALPRCEHLHRDYRNCGDCGAVLEPRAFIL